MFVDLFFSGRAFLDDAPNGGNDFSGRAFSVDVPESGNVFLVAHLPWRRILLGAAKDMPWKYRNS